MSGADILERQHHDRALALLAAQRQLYRHAKRLLATQMALLVLVPGILSSLALHDPAWRPWAAVVAIAALVIDVLVLDPLVRSKRNHGAIVQEAFDVLVFSLEWPIWRLASRPDQELIQDASSHILASTRERSRLLGWYPLAIGRLSDLRAVLLCQRYNIVYGMRIRRPVAMVLLLLVSALCVGFLALTVYLDLKLADALLSVAVPALPMLSWTWREYVRQRDHVATQERIKGSIEKAIAEVGTGALAGAAASERVRHIQNEILAARMSDPLIFDWIYLLLRPRNEKTMAAAAEDQVNVYIQIKDSAR